MSEDCFHINAQAVVEHTRVIHHGRAAQTSRILARWYVTGNHGLSDVQAEEASWEKESEANRSSRLEGDALRQLNTALRAGGAEAGDEAVILGHVYRVANAGCYAVRLGAMIPGEALDSLDAALAGESDHG